MSNEKWFYLSGGHITTDVGPHWPRHVVCEVNAEHPDHEDRSRLIAAAPDLLAALSDLVSEFRWQKFNVRKDFSKLVKIEAARKAIARATGQS